MKIAFIMWTPSVIAGGNYVIYRHAQFLKEAGHDVRIIFVNEGDGFKIYGYSDLSIPAMRLDEIIHQREKYDICIATFWPTFYYMFLVESSNYMYFVQSDERRFLENPKDTDIPFVQRTYCQEGVGYITEAKWIRDYLENEFHAQVEYAPNGIDTELFNPQVKPIARKGNRVRVLIEGPGDVFFKRVNFAFHAVSRFKHIEVWYVSSDGMVKDEWRCDRIFKQVDLKDMPSIYRSCDILLKLSVVEGFFGPPLEMMACGGTVIVSNVTGHDEYVIDGYNGMVVEKDNGEQVHLALKKLISDKALRRRLSRNGVQTAKNMDWRVKCPLYKEGIEKLLAKDLRVNIKDKTEILLLRGLLESKWATQALQNRP